MRGNYVCPVCFRKIGNCKCAFPPETLIQIDKPLHFIIQKLNDKNYRTRFCCSGHWESTRELYIMFWHDIIVDAPQGFKIEHNNTIRYKYKARTQEDFEAEQKEAVKKIMAWIKTLE